MVRLPGMAQGQSAGVGVQEQVWWAAEAGRLGFTRVCPGRPGRCDGWQRRTARLQGGALCLSGGVVCSGGRIIGFGAPPAALEQARRLGRLHLKQKRSRHRRPPPGSGSWGGTTRTQGRASRLGPLCACGNKPRQTASPAGASC